MTYLITWKCEASIPIALYQLGNASAAFFRKTHDNSNWNRLEAFFVSCRWITNVDRPGPMNYLYGLFTDTDFCMSYIQYLAYVLSYLMVKDGCWSASHHFTFQVCSRKRGKDKIFSSQLNQLSLSRIKISLNKCSDIHKMGKALWGKTTVLFINASPETCTRHRTLKALKRKVWSE